jgi:uncharacterized membrane protein YdjX (TVP38/TMEM64 family)
MPFAATSYTLGFTKIGLRAYLLGTVASLPALLGYVVLGALANAGVSAKLDDFRWVLFAVGATATSLTMLQMRRILATLQRRWVPTAGVNTRTVGSNSHRYYQWQMENG